MVELVFVGIPDFKNIFKYCYDILLLLIIYTFIQSLKLSVLFEIQHNIGRYIIYNPYALGFPQRTTLQIFDISKPCSGVVYPLSLTSTTSTTIIIY